MQSMYPFRGKHANQLAYICMFIHARRDYGCDMQMVTAEVLFLHARHHPRFQEIHTKQSLPFQWKDLNMSLG